MPIADLNFLIAEDHGFQRRMLVRMLERLGVRSIHEAADGHEALEVIHDLGVPVDIVISDLDMPGMDGMEFIRRLGESKRRVSIIVSSSLESKLLASVATMTQAYGVTLLGVVEKPLTPEKLGPLLGLYRSPQSASTQAHAGPVFSLEAIVAGLEKDEFEPFLQPKIELGTGHVKGVEALARWRHPQLGIVAPYAFIKVLEDRDRIDDLTWIMLGKAAQFCSEWRAAGVDASVSVNLSLKSLGHTNVADRVTKLVRSRNLDPRHMVLEVTESAATTEVGIALENLARLRMKGFGLSIDDYGTGYSSMQQLTRIAFTELKIDQSFVMNAAKQSSARVILESSLDMARKLNITSVAEGVETQADLDLLRDLCCDMAQGYFIARPMEYAAFKGWIKEWEAGSQLLATTAEQS
jgi:EAL domain-containing protein (putative c-di-GMP-specific phosphodiesterase class I)/AmiR/NasT family two-component response regulator